MKDIKKQKNPIIIKQNKIQMKFKKTINDRGKNARCIFETIKEDDKIYQ